MAVIRAVILTLLAVIGVFYLFQFTGHLNYSMPDWTFSGIEFQRRAAPADVADTPAEVPLAAKPPVIASASSNKLVVKTDKAAPALKLQRYIAKLPKQWDDIRSPDNGLNWNKLGTKCTIPQNGVIVRLEPWSPEGALNTIWHAQYVDQKNAIIENNQIYCPINSDQGILDTDLATYYTPAP